MTKTPPRITPDIKDGIAGIFLIIKKLQLVVQEKANS